jgi:hypothetical protein
MIFEEALQVVAEVIEPACVHVGLSPVRADGLARAGEITEQIFRRLRDDDVVIADLTGANANVMYELGLRHTQNKLTVQIGEYSRLPFDVNTIRTVQFSRSPYGLVTARDELIQVLQAGLGGDFDPVSATRVWTESSEINTPDEVYVADDTVAQDNSEAARATEPESQPRDSQDDHPDDRGFLDILAEGEERQEDLSPAVEAVNEIITELGALADAARDRTEQSDSAGRGMRGRLQVATWLAGRLSELGPRLDGAVDHYEEVLQAVSAANLLLIEAMEQDPEAREAGYEFGMIVRRTAVTARESLTNLASLVDSLNDNAGLSCVLKEPTRRLTSALKRFANATSMVDEWDRHLQSLDIPIPSDDWEPAFDDEEQGEAPDIDGESEIELDESDEPERRRA